MTLEEIANSPLFRTTWIERLIIVVVGGGLLSAIVFGWASLIAWVLSFV